MPTILAYHDVKDVKHWLTSLRRKEVFEPLGCTNLRTFVDPQASNRVGLVMDVPDMGRLEEFMKSRQAADAMEYDGVLPETLVILTQS